MGNMTMKLGIARRKHPFHNVLPQYTGLSHEEIVKIQKRHQKPIHAMLLNVEGCPNIGTMVRTACLSRISKVWIVGRRSYDKRPVVGADKYIEIERISALKPGSKDIDPKAIDALLKENSLFPIVAEDGGEILGKIDWRKVFEKICDEGLVPCVIMGNEWEGISEEVMDVLRSRAHILVTIPYGGVIRSYNVGHAFAIIMWDIRRSMGWF